MVIDSAHYCPSNSARKPSSPFVEPQLAHLRGRIAIGRAYLVLTRSARSAPHGIPDRGPQYRATRRRLADRNRTRLLASAELYRPATAMWTRGANLGVARLDHTEHSEKAERFWLGEAAVRQSEMRTCTIRLPHRGLEVARTTHTATRLRSGLVLAAEGTDDQSFPVSPDITNRSTRIAQKYLARRLV